MTEVAPALPLREREEIGSATARKGRNEEADHLFADGEICFLSFDIEHGGEYCGILQLSAEFVRLGIEEAANGSYSNDKASYVHRHTECFDMYVNQGDSAFWDEHASAVHGLKPTDDCIRNAEEIRVVWSKFVLWFHDLAASVP